MTDKGEVPEQLKPFLFKKGNKLGGRKPGKTMKEYARDYLSNMSEEDRVVYLNNLGKDLIWQMAEGRPEQKLGGELNLKVEKLEEIQKDTKELLNEQD